MKILFHLSLFTIIYLIIYCPFTTKGVKIKSNEANSFSLFDMFKKGKIN